MLERQLYQEQRPDEDNGQSLTPSNIYKILKRRAFYFAIPFLLILVIGSLITIAWPARYLSEGTILVSAQEIPSDLVRPTVATLANERIQVIEQRIMTRDNLLAIAKKYQLSIGIQGRVSGTEIIDFIRDRTKIAPSELKLQGQLKQAIAFKVGFEYERPQIAMMVANELLTMILKEDVRSRTDFATETTRFIEQEAKRLEGQLGLIDTQISELKRSGIGGLTDTTQSDLATLKAQLLLKSATASEAHPDITALKRKIAALEKLLGATNASAKTSQKTAVAANTNASGLDALANTNSPELDSLETKRTGLREELNKATQKLSAARLGESLERGQHSERLEVIEQPTMPTKPVSPNRPKIFAFVFVAALMAGGGLVFAAEALNQSIRRSTDLFSLVDSHLVVSIPYISTHNEMLRRKSTIWLAIGILMVVVLVGLIVLINVLPPLDVLFEKVTAPLFG